MLLRTLRRILAGCILGLMPLWAWPYVVSAAVDDTGKRIAIWEVPRKGETPTSLHRRYCGEPSSAKAVWDAVLTPNGITNDRRMPAHEPLQIRCQEFRTVWQSVPLFTGTDPKLIKQVSALESEVAQFRASAARENETLRAKLAEMTTPVTGPQETVIVWDGPVRWMFLVWVLIAFALIVIAAALIRSMVTVAQERELSGNRTARRGGFGFAATEPPSLQPEPAMVVPPPQFEPERDGKLPVTVSIRDRQGNRLRKFQYAAPKLTGGGYQSLRSNPSPLFVTTQDSGQAIAADVREALELYVNRPLTSSTVEVRLEVDQAIRDGRLTELL